MIDTAIRDAMIYDGSGAPAVAGDVGFTAKPAQYGLGYPPPDQVVIRQQHFDVERLGEGRDVLAARRRLHGGFGGGEEIG